MRIMYYYTSYTKNTLHEPKPILIPSIGFSLRLQPFSHADSTPNRNRIPNPNPNPTLLHGEKSPLPNPTINIFLCL